MTNETEYAAGTKPVSAPTQTSTAVARPDAASLLNKGLAFHRNNQLDDAEKFYRRALHEDPSLAAAWGNLGVLLRRTGRHAAAVLCLKRSLALNPDDGSNWSNLGNALRMQGRYREAYEAQQEALDLAPDAPQVHYNSGLTARDLGYLDEALHCFHRADLLGYKAPELVWDRALAHLLQGNLTDGFKDYEARWKLPESPPRHAELPQWDGTDLDGTLLVYAEQGLGDSLQFCRYLPLVKDKVQRVVCEIQPELLSLLTGSRALAGVEFVARGSTLPPVDAACPMLSLPRVAGTAIETIPADTPYIDAPEADGRRPTLRARKHGHLRIGITWAGKPSHRNDHNRSLSLMLFAPLLELPNVRFFSFQVGPAQQQIEAAALDTVITDLSPYIRDFSDTASFLQGMDLVISADTSLCHLAGGMGRPCWTLLPYAPDWRWMLHRGDTPWYPDMTLYRQTSPGDWEEVFARVRRSLRERIRDNKAA